MFIRKQDFIIIKNNFFAQLDEVSNTARPPGYSFPLASALVISCGGIFIRREGLLSATSSPMIKCLEGPIQHHPPFYGKGAIKHLGCALSPRTPVVKYSK